MYRFMGFLSKRQRKSTISKHCQSTYQDTLIYSRCWEVCFQLVHILIGNRLLSRPDRPLVVPWILSCSSLFLAFKVLEIFLTITVSF